MAKSENFSKHFLWGASTSSHQVEGNTHNQWSVWELENARALAAQSQYQEEHYDSWERIKSKATSPSNYVSGNASEHYTRYKEDFDLLQKMNMNAYRFSIEWSRIEPKEGVWNAEALTHYKNYIQELRRRDIEPIMTLFHFTLPVWFAEKGGFEKRSNVKYFTRFVEKAVSELGTHIKFFITVNEPEVYAGMSYASGSWPPNLESPFKSFLVVNNLIRAHNRSAKIIHKINRRAKVSIAKHSLYFYPGDNAWITRLSAHIGQWIADDYILKRVRKHCDFIGLNYYQSMRTYGYRVHNPETPVNDVDWTMSPRDIEYVLERLHEKYKLPIIITENGVADDRDAHRKWWITETIIGIKEAMKRGVEVNGYFHWSLTDNFEWAFGLWPRFGLTEIDYKTQKRTLRPSAMWFGGVIKKLRGL